MTTCISYRIFMVLVQMQPRKHGCNGQHHPSCCCSWKDKKLHSDVWCQDLCCGLCLWNFFRQNNVEPEPYRIEGIQPHFDDDGLVGGRIGQGAYDQCFAEAANPIFARSWISSFLGYRFLRNFYIRLDPCIEYDRMIRCWLKTPDMNILDLF